MTACFTGAHERDRYRLQYSHNAVGWCNEYEIRVPPVSSHERCHQRYHYNTILVRCFSSLLGSVFASTGRYRTVELRDITPHAPRTRVVIVYSYRYEHIQNVTRVFYVLTVAVLISPYDPNVGRWIRWPIQNRSARVTSTAVSLVIIRTRSRSGGARGRERGGVTVLGVRTLLLQRCVGAHCLQCIMQPTVVPPSHNWSTMKGTTKYQNMGLLIFRFVLVSSSRTKGSFYFFLFVIYRKNGFRYEPSGTTVVPHTTFNDMPGR